MVATAIDYKLLVAGTHGPSAGAYFLQVSVSIDLFAVMDYIIGYYHAAHSSLVCCRFSDLMNAPTTLSMTLMTLLTMTGNPIR